MKSASSPFSPVMAGASTVRTISLALQGGGSHGAFTWGVLDVLLEDPRIRIEAASGASAGAVNAVAMAHGLALPPADEPDTPAARAQSARDTLARVWRGVASIGSLGTMAEGMARMLSGSWGLDPAGSGLFGGAVARMVSPYQANPLGINPLRRLLDTEIDFDALARPPAPRVFVSATQVRTGRAEIFHDERLTLDAVMASTCLPMMFHAVEIDGEPYWDGGYSANPPIVPLVDLCESRDIVLVQLNPMRRDALPRTAHDIAERVGELSFNASLLAQMRNIDFTNGMLARGVLVEGEGFRSVRLHRIDGDATMAEMSASSKLSTDPAMMERLFEQGRDAAQAWLAAHFDALGERGTIDIRQDYVGDLPGASQPRPTARAQKRSAAPR